jgi:hypothetical protein
MKWFDRWFARKCRWAWENTREFADEPSMVPATSAKQPRLESVDDWEDGLRITVKRVIGGSVVSFRTYDPRKDRSESRHYIITDEQDFNTELGKMITMESMRQT